MIYEDRCQILSIFYTANMPLALIFVLHMGRISDPSSSCHLFLMLTFPTEFLCSQIWASFLQTKETKCRYQIKAEDAESEDAESKELLSC